VDHRSTAAAELAAKALFNKYSDILREAVAAIVASLMEAEIAPGHVDPKALVVAYWVHEPGRLDVIGLDIGKN
jgi:hypothetical protein